MSSKPASPLTTPQSPSSDTLNEPNKNARTTSQTVQSSGDSSSSLYGGIGRSLTRAVALYFSRPIRLFRPAKVSGWITLRGAAERHGSTLTPQYLSLLIRKEGLKIIPRHFLPPIIVNSALGFILFETFSYSNNFLQTHFTTAPTIAIAAASGALGGGIHAIAGAPADNVRLLLEGSYRKKLPAGAVTGWRAAWMEIFREVQHIQHVEPTTNATLKAAPIVQVGGPKSRKEAREVRQWMKEVRGMAGRGWDGMGWGLGKDIFGFAVFFAIFDVTRQLSQYVARSIDSKRLAPLDTFEHVEADRLSPDSVKMATSTSARIGQSVTLVGGGLVAGLGFEWIARPFDNARRIVYEHRSLPSLTASTVHRSSLPPREVIGLLTTQIKEEGVLSLFKLPVDPVASHEAPTRGYRTKIALRALARLGPWSIAFLMWEGMGSDIARGAR